MTTKKFIYRFEGKGWECSYEVTGGKHPIVTVTTPWGSKPTQKGGSPSLTIARFMAGELARASQP